MAAKPLKGYKRLPGTAKRYLTPNGVEISQYEYQSRQARRVRDSQGKRIWANASQQRRFRERQEFMRLRFNVGKISGKAVIGIGSDLEAASSELLANPDYGRSGTIAYEQKENSRLGQLLAAQGFPDWYFWRFWYSETRG